MNASSLNRPTAVAPSTNPTTLRSLPTSFPYFSKFPSFPSLATPSRLNPLPPTCDNKSEICDTNERKNQTQKHIQLPTHKQQTPIHHQKSPRKKASLSSQTSTPPPISSPSQIHVPVSAPDYNSAPNSDHDAHRLAYARRLLPATGRQRKLRCDSFFAKLPPARQATLVAWFEEDSISDIHRRIAAPEPEGWGLQVDRQSLYRAKTFVDSFELNHWISVAMDHSYDILHSETTSDTAPVREAVSQLLHARLMTCAVNQADIPAINQLIMALTRLEKLNNLRSSPLHSPMHSPMHSPLPRTAPAPSQLHRVHLTVSTTNPNNTRNQTPATTPLHIQAEVQPPPPPTPQPHPEAPPHADTNKKEETVPVRNGSSCSPAHIAQANHPALHRGVVVPLEELLLPGVVDPGDPCDEVPLLCDPPCELLPLCDELPEVEEPAAPDAPLRLLGNVELPGLMPRCEPAAPGEPMLLAPDPLCCCSATVRVNDSTICSSRATRASSEPEPEIELPELNVPLLPTELPLDVPKVPDPPTDED